jgi:hypothetical protein
MVSNGATVYAHRRGIGVSEHRPEMMEFPSILGMDVIREWEILFSYPDQIVRIIVKKCDEQRSI